MRTMRIGAFVLLWMFAGSQPARALSIVGSWQVSGACKGNTDDGLAPFKYKALGELDVTQTGSVVHASPGSGVVLTGTVITDSADPNKGIVTLNTCGLSAAGDAADGNSVLIFAIKTGGGDTGKMTGSQVTSFWDVGSTTNQFCKLKLKRFNNVDPNIGSCPP